MVGTASLWLDQLFMGLIHYNHEDLPLDQPLGEDTPLDLDPGMLEPSVVDLRKTPYWDGSRELSN